MKVLKNIFSRAIDLKKEEEYLMRFLHDTSPRVNQRDRVAPFIC